MRFALLAAAAALGLGAPASAVIPTFLEVDYDGFALGTTGLLSEDGFVTQGYTEVVDNFGLGRGLLVSATDIVTFEHVDSRHFEFGMFGGFAWRPEEAGSYELTVDFRFDDLSTTTRISAFEYAPGSSPTFIGWGFNGQPPIPTPFTKITIHPLLKSGVPTPYVLDSFEVFLYPAGAVPEPATWAMLILGFGAVGGVLRRREWRSHRDYHRKAT